MENFSSTNGNFPMPTMMQIFAEELLKAGRNDPNIVALSADVPNSTGLKLFAETFPDRYFETGICEQNMIGAAAGMALAGKKAVASSYACFSPGRTWEQIRNAVCLDNADVKIVGAHIGVGSGRNGATHQSFEDIALMTCLPNMKVYSPATERDTRLCAREMLDTTGPAYIRLSAELCPVSEDYHCDLSHPAPLKYGTDFAVIGTGGILRKALRAIETLDLSRHSRIAVFNLVRLDALNADILAPLKSFKAVLCLEEHQINGGLASLIAPFFAESKDFPPLYRMGVELRFGASMDPEDLYAHLNLSEQDVLNRLTKIVT